MFKLILVPFVILIQLIQLTYVIIKAIFVILISIMKRLQLENQKRKDWKFFKESFNGMNYSNKELKKLYEEQGY